MTKFAHRRSLHIRPDSVFVAAISTHWQPKAWQKVLDMVAYTNEQGYCCWFHEIQDTVVVLPYQHLNPMRDTACLEAHNSGAEYLLLIENDVLPEKDMLIRLLRWHMPVVVPYMFDEKLGRPIAAPSYPKNKGLQVVEWSVLSCILIWCKVLNCFNDCSPFRDVMHEGLFYKRLIHFGHQAYQDTSTELKLAQRPTYHGDRSSLDDLWEFWKEKDLWRRQEPDRSPIDPDDPCQVDGMYLPKSMMDKMGGKGLSDNG